MAMPLLLCLPYGKSSGNYLSLAAQLPLIVLISFVLIRISQRSAMTRCRFASVFVPASLIFCFQMLELVSYYLQGTSFNNAFFFHVSLQTMKTGWTAYRWMIVLPLTASIVVGAADLSLLRKMPPQQKNNPVALWIIALFIGVAILPNSAKHFIGGYRAYLQPHAEDLQDRASLEAALKAKGVNIAAFSQRPFRAKIPARPKNIIILYLESLESSYLEESAFPALVPNINRELAKSFSFGNMRQYEGTNYTLSGIIASLCGMPVMGPANFGNDVVNQNAFYQKITCLPDVLARAGYSQTYMGGASLAFAGKGQLMKAHGYNEVLGREELMGLSKSISYHSGWGLYDDTLFDLAAKKADELSGKASPFNLTLLTLDTHHPDGDASKSCPSYRQSDNSMLQAVHCTDYLFGRFMKTIQQKPWYADTVVYVMSDHLAMRNVADHLYPKDRKLLAFVVNAGTVGRKDLASSPFDVPSTLLNLLGIETDVQFALGQDLLKEERPERLDIYKDRGLTLLQQYAALQEQDHGINICAEGGISVEDVMKRTIRIGNRSFEMSENGLPQLPVKSIYLVRSTPQGNVLNMQMASSEEASRIMETYPDSIYFLLGRVAAFPHGLWQKDKTPLWQWYLGNPSSPFGRSGSLPDLRDMKISQTVCQSILSRSRMTVPFTFSLRKTLN